MSPVCRHAHRWRFACPKAFRGIPLTNPPIITLVWPQDGDTIAGTDFTLRGTLDDFTASLTAQIADTNGNTSTVAGTVERNGSFWVENAPLASGTNYITLTAMNAAGNTSVTNFVVNNLGTMVTIDDFSNLLAGSTQTTLPTVTGTTSLTGCTVWVNGVAATQSGNTWEADNVPISPGGTAVVEASAVPNSPGNPSTPASIAAQMEIDQPTTTYMENYQYASASTTIEVSQNDGCVATTINRDMAVVNDPFASAGAANSTTFYSYSDCTGSDSGWWNWACTWPCHQCIRIGNPR